MEKYSIAGAIVLSLMVMLARRPSTAVLALLGSFLFAMPIQVFASGLGSAVYACDVVLGAMVLRWGGTALQQIRARGAPPLSNVFGVMTPYVYFVTAAGLLSLGTVLGVLKFGFFSLRFTVFAGQFLLLAALPYTLLDYRRLVGGLALMFTGLAGANLINRMGLMDLNFYAYYELMKQAGVSGAIQVRQGEAAGIFFLGFDRASNGIFAYLGVITVLLRAWMGGSAWRVIAFLAVPLMLLYLLDSFSRAALLAFLVAGGLAAMLIRSEHTMHGIATLAVAAVGAVFVGVDPTGWVERFAALFSREAFEQSTGQGRVQEWITVISFLLSNPQYLLLGAGFMNYKHLTDIGGATYDAGHNMFIHATGELGIVGLGLWIWLWSSMALVFYRQHKNYPQGHPGRLVCAVLAATVCGAIASGVSQESLYPNFSVYGAVCMMMGLIAASIGAFCRKPALVPAPRYLRYVQRPQGPQRPTPMPAPARWAGHVQR